MKYISLFAGIGGFDLALNRLGHECVYANEWDKYAATIYRRNLCSQPTNEKPEQTESKVQLGGKWATLEEERSVLPTDHRRIGTICSYDIDTRDIRTVSTQEIPDHDLLVGGFPCQAFSIAGKRRGFDDTRGTLFFEIARILKDKQPKFFILENVKGLLSHDNGFTFKTIISTLTELGYDLQWQVLNSKNFGVPQNRERVFIVGHIRGQPRPEVFPITGNSQANFSGVSIIDGYNRKESKEIGAIRQNMLNGGSLINNTNILGRKTHTPNIRRLTPTECERLQGFPDGWTEGVSDTQRYKCLGNAVTVNVVYEVARRL